MMRLVLGVARVQFYIGGKMLEGLPPAPADLVPEANSATATSCCPSRQRVNATQPDVSLWGLSTTFQWGIMRPARPAKEESLECPPPEVMPPSVAGRGRPGGGGASAYA